MSRRHEERPWQLERLLQYRSFGLFDVGLMVVLARQSMNDFTPPFEKECSIQVGWVGLHESERSVVEVSQKAINTQSQSLRDGWKPWPWGSRAPRAIPAIGP